MRATHDAKENDAPSYTNLLLVKDKDCICAAELSRRCGVHRGTVCRALAQFAESLGVNSQDMRLGREYLLMPAGIKEFTKFVQKRKSKSPLAKGLAALEFNEE